MRHTSYHNLKINEIDLNCTPLCVKINKYKNDIKGSVLHYPKNLNLLL